MQSEHPNVTLVRGMWSAIAEGDGEKVASFFSKDVVWKAFGRNPLSGDYHGPDGVLDYLAQIGERSDDLKTRLDSVFFNEDGAVLAMNVAAARGARRLDMDFLTMFIIRDGRIVRASSVPVDQAENDRFWS